MEIQQLVIPEVTISKINKKPDPIHCIYIPVRFNRLLESMGRPVQASLILEGRELKLGVKRPYKKDKITYILILPKDLSELWERNLGRQADLILEKIPLN